MRESSSAYEEYYENKESDKEGNTIVMKTKKTKKTKKINSYKDLPKIDLTELMAGIVLHFLENIAELGCPKDAEPDMWFRYLSAGKMKKVMRKLQKIITRDYDIS